VTFLAGQVTILTRHCPLAGRYFEPQKVFLFSEKDVWPALNPAARLDSSQPHTLGLFSSCLGVTGRRETWKAGNKACPKPNFTKVAF